MPSWYRYAIHGSFEDVDTMRNVFYLETQTAISSHTVVIGELLNQLYAPFIPYLGDAVKFSGADVSEHFAGTGWGVNIFYPSVVIQGTDDTTEMLPHQIAGCVTAYTIQKGVRGRKFIGGFTEGAQANGLLIPTAYTVIQGFGTVWAAGIQPPAEPAVNFRIFSEKTGLFHAIRTATGRQLLATMRTRKPGRGLG